MNIKQVDHIENTELVLFLTRAWVELAELGLADPKSVLVGSDDSCLYFKTREHGIVGALSYVYFDNKSMIHVGLGYVIPSHRNAGVYRKLWNELVNVARANKVRTISGGSAPDNAAIAAFNKKVGRKIISHEYRYELS